jgi:hypothetical protein
MGNHDRFALGNFPIIPRWDGTLVAPLPLDIRPGILLPTVLDPVGSLTHGPVTPAHPGPPPLLDLPVAVTPVANRRYFTRPEFIQTLLNTRSGPAGHGFASLEGPPWYSISPVSGLRLIMLDTADQQDPVPGLPYSEGCISQEQREFLQAELDAAQGRGEWVIVATHHPSSSLEALYGSALDPQGIRDLLNQYPNVLVHLAGHNHRNRVADRGGYIEIETCSTLDWPQEARVVEIWRDASGRVSVTYRMFSGLEDTLPALGDDPLRGLREQAHVLANPDKSLQNMRRGTEPLDPNPQGQEADRKGIWHKPWARGQ